MQGSPQGTTGGQTLDGQSMQPVPQPQGYGIPAPPSQPWVDNPALPGAANTPSSDQRPSFAPPMPPWMGGGQQGEAAGAGAVQGKTSEAAKPTPWWGGVVTDGGSAK